MMRSARSRNTILVAGLVALVYASLAVMAAELCVASRRSLQQPHAPWFGRGCSSQCALRLGLSGYVRCRAGTGAICALNGPGQSRLVVLVSPSGNLFVLFFSAPLPCALRRFSLSSSDKGPRRDCVVLSPLALPYSIAVSYPHI